MAASATSAADGVTVDDCGEDLCGAAFDAKGTLYVASRASGAVMTRAADGSFSVWNDTAGQPSAIAFDKSGRLYVADLAHAAVLIVQDDGQLQLVVREYEGARFKGPSSLTFDKEGSMYFTDSGPLGETTLQSPTGSCFVVTGSADGKILRPLALDCLAHPSGVAVLDDGSAVFVAEMLTNRVLRFVQRPTGVYHMSVFHQFSGRLGPSAITCDKSGFLYVARYDFKEASEKGIVSVLDTDGMHVRDISIRGAEVTSLAVTPDGTSLVVTEASSRKVYEVPV